MSNYRYFNVPDESDTPDVPRDFRLFADSQWNKIGAVSAQNSAAMQVNSGQGDVEVIGVNHPYPAGALLLVSASMQLGNLGPVQGFFAIRSDNALVSPEISVGPQPAGTFPMTSFYISTGPSRIAYKLTMWQSNLQVTYRYINVRALLRG